MDDFVDLIISFSKPKRSEDYLEGVIYWSLKNQKTVNVRYSSTYSVHPPNSIIKGNSQNDETNYFHSQDEGAKSWIEVVFTKEWIIPSSYIIKESGNIRRLRNWNIEASQDGINYDILDTQKDFETFQEKYQIESFPIRRKIYKPYRIFRIQQTMSDNSIALRIGRFEVYGETAFCYNDCLTPPKFFTTINMLVKSISHSPLY